jgi:hypothetical protein
LLDRLALFLTIFKMSPGSRVEGVERQLHGIAYDLLRELASGVGEDDTPAPKRQAAKRRTRRKREA